MDDIAAIVVLRQGMNVPEPSYVESVLASAYPGGLDPSVTRVALSQPSWFKNAEIAESAAADVSGAYARKLALEDAWHEYRTLEGPDGAHVMLVELRRG